MAKKRKTSGRRTGLQSVTLCISTALVLILLGLIVFSTLTGRNLSSYVKENLVVTVMLQQNMSESEAQGICKSLQQKPYIKSLHYISKAEALREGTKAMGADPSEFTNGVNPFPPSIELTLKSNYANNDSLAKMSRELHRNVHIADVTYQKDLVDTVNQNLTKIGIVFLVLAALLTFVSFTLINNTVRLSIYARRFSIHTMKLVGASWSFIRWPFVRRAILVGVLAAVLANAVLAGVIYAFYCYEPDILTIVTWREMAITGVSVFVFGVVITAFCSSISVTKYLRMKAGELYKI